MKRISLLSIFIFTFIFFTSTVKADEIAIPGTGDGVAVLEAIGNAFTEKEGVAVRVPKSIGSGGAIKVVGNDQAIVGRVARGIKDKEKHYGLEYKAIFEVPTVIFVNKNVTVDNLTDRQVVDIFSGQTTNWKDVGGQDASIIVVRREDKDSSLNNLKKTFPGFKDLVFTKDSTLAEKTFIMTAQIVNRPDSIGFGPYDVAVANGLKALSINGVKPTDPNYPYFGTIGLVYKPANLDANSKKFIEFATSGEADSIVEKFGGRKVLH